MYNFTHLILGKKLCFLHSKYKYCASTFIFHILYYNKEKIVPLQNKSELRHCTSVCWKRNNERKSSREAMGINIFFIQMTKKN